MDNGFLQRAKAVMRNRRIAGQLRLNGVPSARNSLLV
jgi:hypothetical protein